MSEKTNTKPMGTVSVRELRERMANGDDAVFTELITSGGVTATAVFIDGMVSSETVYDFILRPIAAGRVLADARAGEAAVERIMDGRVFQGRKKLCLSVDETTMELLSGSVAVIFDDVGAAVAFEARGFEKRAVSEPTSENVLKGSKEAFVEALRVNTALVRRRVKTSDLKIRQISVGRRTNTQVAIVYIEGIANRDTVAKIVSRFQSADTDGLVTAGQIESIMYERRHTLFPQALYTERPDRFVGSVLEGRVGIIVDGLPVTYITPIDFHTLLQAPEDYAHHFVLSSLFRIMRYVCAAASLMLPAFYVAVTTYHQEMIPTKLAISMISSKQGAPFPTYMEVTLMLLAFEVLLEAGLRLPRAVGQTVSIVGALVVGQAAITANILSPGVVIVISVSGITGFAVPNQDLSNACRVFRLSLVALATFGGLFTTTLGLILILYDMCSIEIFGTPYLSPLAGSEGRGMLDDTLVRRAWTTKRERPRNIAPEDAIRHAREDTEE
ncbi:MAG: spore germination protein [Oscillospiraceae bacterium]|jgi:spore germination protein KA|nr:spore germination protein [Oscillospiraceae bacterium]